MEKPASNVKKTKTITIELNLEDYWQIQDIQRRVERERGIKRSMAHICAQLVREAVTARRSGSEPESAAMPLD